MARFHFHTDVFKISSSDTFNKGVSPRRDLYVADSLVYFHMVYFLLVADPTLCEAMAEFVAVGTTAPGNDFGVLG